MVEILQLDVVSLSRQESLSLLRDAGGLLYAVEMYSLFGTCKVLGKNSKEWLVYVLDHIKDTKSQDMHSIQQSDWVEC